MTSSAASKINYDMTGMTTTCLLSVLGILMLLRLSYRFYVFIRPFLLPSSIDRFVHGADTYALVTGASDGIGKEIARELYRKGLNIILHGRDEAKLWKTASDIRVGQGPMKDIKVWVADACSPDIDYESAVERWKRLNISLVVHNVSPYAPRTETIDNVPENELLKDIRCGVHFPFLLTRALLPKLRTSSGPAKIVFIGSFGGSHPMPRLSPVSPTKAFLRQLSGNIVADERFPGLAPADQPRDTNVSCMYVLVGSVVSAGHKVQESLLSPSARTFARSVVDRIGCEQSVVAPYLPQAIMFTLVDMLGEGLQERLFRQSMQDELALRAKSD